MSTLRIRCVAAAVLACATACSRAPAGANAIVGQGSSAAVEIGSPQALIERIQTAPMRVRHAGTRRLQFYYEVEGVQRKLEYQEHVVTDGNGRFALDPLEVAAPPMSTAQREVFDLQQKAREGFFFRYRDFGVRQRDLFAENYRVQVLGSSLTVAGRECSQIEVRHRRAGPTWYQAAVDVETGLVLRWSEFSTAGQLVARSEYLDITLDPVLDGVDWFVSPLQIVALEPGHESAALLGFQPHQVQLLPAGYQILRSEMLHEGATTWLRRVYGDGVENLFVLERGADAAPSPKASRVPANADATQRTALGDAPVTLVVRLCQVGAWTLAEAAQGSAKLFVVGKVGEDDVVSCLKSAF